MNELTPTVTFNECIIGIGCEEENEPCFVWYKDTGPVIVLNWDYIKQKSKKYNCSETEVLSDIISHEFIHFIIERDTKSNSFWFDKIKCKDFGKFRGCLV